MNKRWHLPYRHHLYPLISTLLMIFGLIIITEYVRVVNIAMITAVVAIYFFSNIIYGIIHRELDWRRFVELLLLSVLLEYLSILYLI